MRRFLENGALVAGGILGAVALIAIAELGLRLFGVGGEPSQQDPFAGFSQVVPMFEPATRDDGVHVYRMSRAREISAMGHFLDLEPQREFLAQKPPGTFRIFVLGDSSAAGVPYGTGYAFSTWLARRLEGELPDMRVEVVNAALPGYASRRLLIAAHEVAAYAPDLVIVYNGHNEFAERRFYAPLLDMDPRVFRAWEALAHTRLWGLLSRFASRFRPSSEPAESRALTDDRTAGREMFSVIEERVNGHGYATPRERAYETLLYESNLGSIVRTLRAAGAHVMLLTLTQNFANWPPAASAHREGLSAGDLATWTREVADGDRLLEARDCEAALAAYARALSIDDTFGDLRFRVAQCEEELGQFDAARAEYRVASDLDQVPQGAPTAFNDEIKEVARKEGALLADVDTAVAVASAHGLVGDDLIVDSLHPNIRAHQIIAETIAKTLRASGVPVPPERWTVGDYRDPDPETLYTANPRLRAQEHLARMAMCYAAHRKQCAVAAIDAAIEVEPTEQGFQNLRASLLKDAAAWTR
jgi:lysophospholipase L1-like esterase